jgi:hypothetical protein
LNNWWLLKKGIALWNLLFKWRNPVLKVDREIDDVEWEVPILSMFNTELAYLVNLLLYLILQHGAVGH